MNLKYVFNLICGVLLLEFFLAPTLSAADSDLLDLVIVPVREDDLESRLQDAGNFREAASGGFPLKEFEAFGVRFHGRITKRDHAVDTVSLSCADPMLSSNEASRLSSNVQNAIERLLGEGRTVNNIPNHEDATDVESRGKLWAGPQESVIKVTTDDYTNRANFSVVRYLGSFPLAETGEAKEFWQDHLKAIRSPKDKTSIKDEGDSRNGNTSQRTARQATQFAEPDGSMGLPLRWIIPGILLVLITGWYFFLRKTAS